MRLWLYNSEYLYDTNVELLSFSLISIIHFNQRNKYQLITGQIQLVFLFFRRDGQVQKSCLHKAQFFYWVHSYKMIRWCTTAVLKYICVSSYLKTAVVSIATYVCTVCNVNKLTKPCYLDNDQVNHPCRCTWILLVSCSVHWLSIYSNVNRNHKWFVIQHSR